MGLVCGMRHLSIQSDRNVQNLDELCKQARVLEILNEKKQLSLRGSGGGEKNTKA